MNDREWAKAQGIPVVKRQLINTHRQPIDMSQFENRDHDGVTVRRARRLLGLTQSEYADLMNVSPHTVSAWEQGRRNVPPLVLRQAKLVHTQGGSQGSVPISPLKPA